MALAGLSAPAAGAGVPLGSSVRVEYTDSKFADVAYQASEGAPDVRNYSRAAQYHALVRDHFGSVTPENELQFWSVWPTPGGEPNFGPADRIVAWARSIDKQIRGHALVFGDAVPAWLADGQHTGLELRAILRRHIKTTMSRYRGVIKEWDVVNEPILADGGFRPPLLPGLGITAVKESIWARTTARLPRKLRRRVPRYIYEAFRVARKTDPDATLCINEIHAEGINPRSDKLYELVRALRSQNLVDCVGFQGHFGPGHPAPPAGELEQNLARFAALGVKVQFTEIDVPIELGAGSGGVDLGRHDAARRWQHQIYDRLADVCAAQPACSRFTVWGASDANTWRGANTEPLLFRSDMTAKPAYGTVASRLAGAAR